VRRRTREMEEEIDWKWRSGKNWNRRRRDWEEGKTIEKMAVEERNSASFLHAAPIVVVVVVGRKNKRF